MSDLFLLWGNFEHLLTEEGRALGERMRVYWKSFAANHTTGPAPGGNWPAYGGAKKRNYAVLDTPSDSVASQWKQAQCDFLDALAE